MGIWGMGLTQSDEFCEVYDKFMEEYNSGKEPHDISESILTEYYSEFNDNDGVIVDNKFFVALSDELNAAPKTVDSILNANARMASWFSVLIPENQVHALAKIESNENYNGRMGMYFDADANIHFCENCGLEDYWDGFNDYKQRWTFSNLNLRDLLLSENVPVEFVMREQLKQFLREKKC